MPQYVVTTQSERSGYIFNKEVTAINYKEAAMDAVAAIVDEDHANASKFELCHCTVKYVSTGKVRRVVVGVRMWPQYSIISDY